jgi:hypothetical protein
MMQLACEKRIQRVVYEERQLAELGLTARDAQLLDYFDNLAYQHHASLRRRFPAPPTPLNHGAPSHASLCQMMMRRCLVMI